MQSAELKIDFNNLDKPFILIERNHDLGGTDYTIICRLTENHARLLSNEGINWLYSEPDWGNFYKKLALYKAERALELSEEYARQMRIANS